jgi:hypothetical protein
MRIRRLTERDVNPFHDWDGTCDLCDAMIVPGQVWVVDDQDLGHPTRALMNVLLVCAPCTHEEATIRQHLRQKAVEYTADAADRSAELRRMAESPIVRMTADEPSRGAAGG